MIRPFQLCSRALALFVRRMTAMILCPIQYWRNRHLRRAKAEIAAHTFASEKRASIKLTAAYEKRRVRELSHRRDLFERDIAGSRKGLG